MKTWLVPVAVCLLAATTKSFGGPEVPGAAQSTPIAIVGATLHPVTSDPIAEGTILFEQGKIVAMGAEVEVPANAQSIDGSQLHVYPGLFHVGGRVGVMEVASIAATVDVRETGRINPNAKVQVAVNPDSELIPVTRANGVLLTLTVPSGGLISGTSAVLQMDGWTWEDMTLRSPAAMHVNWPTAPVAPAWWDDRGAQGDANDSVASGRQQLRDAFDDATAYQRARQSSAADGHPIDVRWEAMLPVLNREIPLFVDAERQAEIQSAVAFAAERNLRCVIVGGHEAEECAALLRQNDVAVVVSSIHRLPHVRSEDYDTAYTLPSRLHQAQVKFCIAGGERFDGPNARNLPYQAATAVAYGLPHDEALRAITLYPAQILGVSDRVGSLEPGKDATLIITNGDPLETTTDVLRAFIQGREVDLQSRHTRLWQKYSEKYRQISQ